MHLLRVSRLKAQRDENNNQYLESVAGLAPTLLVQGVSRVRNDGSSQLNVIRAENPSSHRALIIVGQHRRPQTMQFASSGSKPHYDSCMAEGIDRIA